MNQRPLVVGLWKSSRTMSDVGLQERFRSVTIAWARYGYRDTILERATIPEVLTAAQESGYRYCFLMAYGCVVHERWRTDEESGGRDFFALLLDWAENHDFTATGVRRRDSDEDPETPPWCLLVDLTKLSAALDAIARHAYSPWPNELARHLLDLAATDRAGRSPMARLFGDGIARGSSAELFRELSEDQRTFIETVYNQTANARRGVFLWNIESYDDVERPRSDFPAPVSTIYAVAAGFKPNRILHTHGLSSASRVVYFDYSPNALQIKKTMVDDWDGDDFPRFVRYLFGKFPHPETFYQLWDNVTPEQVQESELEGMWERELRRWGGAEAFREHWRVYRTLPHEYICCDLLSDFSPLMRSLRRESSGVIWWSNAFFTMYGNWFHSPEKRRDAYQRFIEALSERNPELYVFGSDYNNINVNGLRAAEYCEQFRRIADDFLNPPKLHRTVVRM